MLRYDGPGDIFDCGAQTITCPINTVGAMGAGLALVFRRRVPGLYAFYQDEYSPHGTSRDPARLTKLTVYRVPDGRQVLLFPTKLEWREPSQLAWIESNLVQLAEQYQDMGITSLALPPLGCGLGGLSYAREVKPLVERCLGTIALPVEILHG